MEQTNVNPETWVVDSIHESVQIALHCAPGIYPLRLFIDSAYNLLLLMVHDPGLWDLCSRYTRR